MLAFEYQRDALGRITELSETIDGVETTRVFSYDSAGRLTDVTVGGSVVRHWEYDGNSNRTLASNGGVVTADYDDQDRLVRYGDVDFTYTANGELATREDAAGITEYFYDALGNLRHVELPNGTQIDYLIDARNRRVGKKVDGVLVQGFLYRDQLEPVAELDGNGDVVARFVYATNGHSPDYMLKDGSTYRIVSDHLGSPRLVIDVDTGDVVQEMRFDEWGVVTLDTNPGWQPFGFAGGLLDADTGLTRFGARDYSATEGRWTAKDEVFGMNRFGYSHNDPVNFIDRVGLSEEQVATEAAKQSGAWKPIFDVIIINAPQVAKGAGGGAACALALPALVAGGALYGAITYEPFIAPDGPRDFSTCDECPSPLLAGANGDIKPSTGTGPEDQGDEEDPKSPCTIRCYDDGGTGPLVEYYDNPDEPNCAGRFMAMQNSWVLMGEDVLCFMGRGQH